MAQSLCPPRSEAWILSPGWGPAQPPPPSDNDCGCSPASSPDCWGSTPAASPAPSPAPLAARPGPRAPAPRRRSARGGRLGSGQRQSASEREKLRMRTLARALHELRRFLPPSMAPAGQSLTKIETLRLAIRYIGHLSAVLGLSDDSLQRRRRRRPDPAAPQGCPLCPDGGPAQAQTQTQASGRCSGPAASAAACWGSPPAGHGALAAPELPDPPVLYDQETCPEEQAMEPAPLLPALSQRPGGPAGDLAPGVAAGLRSPSDDGRLAPCEHRGPFGLSTLEVPLYRLPLGGGHPRYWPGRFWKLEPHPGRPFPAPRPPDGHLKAGRRRCPVCLYLFVNKLFLLASLGK